MTKMQNYGEKLTRLREKAHISQDDLAMELDVSRQTISNWERGESIPSEKNLQKVCSFFGVKENYFYFDQEETSVSSVGENSQVDPKKIKRHKVLAIIFGSLVGAMLLTAFVIMSIVYVILPLMESPTATHVVLFHFDTEFFVILWSFLIFLVVFLYNYVQYLLLKHDIRIEKKNRS